MVPTLPTTGVTVEQAEREWLQACETSTDACTIQALRERFEKVRGKRIPETVNYEGREEREDSELSSTGAATAGDFENAA